MFVVVSEWDGASNFKDFIGFNGYELLNFGVLIREMFVLNTYES